MADLENTFSWSHSASKDFEECRRRRYWDKYAKWGGWDRGASREQRDAYRLSKISNRYQLMGDAVEKAVMWMIRENQSGRRRGAAEAFEAVARSLLRSKWDESTGRHWMVSAKKCCLHEHYYPDLHEAVEDRQRIVETGTLVKQCLANFETIFFPRFAGIQPADEVEIASVQDGAPESFEFEGVRIYAIPDYVHRDGPLWMIHDWKAGRPRPEHARQVGVYALWALTKHRIPPERIRLHLEYLQTGECKLVPVSEAELDQVRQDIRDSVADMSEYLENGDRTMNRARPRDEWEMAAEPSVCRRCNFYELCKPELDF